MLSKQITSALTKYYDWWTEQSDQKVYGFTFYSTSLLEYGGCTVFTEEGLEQVTAKYQEMDYYRDTPIDQLKEDLRWSPCDAPNHMTNEEIFSEVCESLEDVSSRLYELEGDDFEQEVEKAYGAVIQGILGFRAERIPLDRDDVLVTMLWGDISPREIAHFIKACNSEAAADKYIQELKLEETEA